MKRLMKILLATALVAVFAGCASTNNDTREVATTLIVYNASYQVLKKNPDLKDEFQTALTKLDAVSSGGLGANDLLEALNFIPKGNEDLKPALTSARILAQRYLNVPVTPEISEQVKNTALSVSNGLRLALNDVN